MNLVGKHALIFAATGGISSVVAQALAQEGAHVWLSGRNSAALNALAATITATGGTADTHIVDATDSDAVNAYVAMVAGEAGRIDVVFNGIGLPPAELGYPAFSATQDFSLFLKPLEIILGSTFLTSRAAGAHMSKQGGGGSIITLSATLSIMAGPFMAGISAACGGIEALTRSLAGEFGRQGCV